MKVKILNIIPAVSDVFTQEMIDFMKEPLDKDTELFSDMIKTGPVSIETSYDEVLVTPQLLEMCQKAEADGIHGVFINCFGDPAVPTARELVKIPVFGGFEPGFYMAMALARTVSIITVMPSVFTMIWDNISKTHLNSRVASVRAIDTPVAHLTDRSAMIDALLEQAVIAVKQDGAQSILLGCTGMAGGAVALKDRLLKKGYDVPVIDPTHAAVTLLEAYIKMGISHSPLTFMPLPKRSPEYYK